MILNDITLLKLLHTSQKYQNNTATSIILRLLEGEDMKWQKVA